MSSTLMMRTSDGIVGSFVEPRPGVTSVGVRRARWKGMRWKGKGWKGKGWVRQVSMLEEV